MTSLWSVFTGYFSSTGSPTMPVGSSKDEIPEVEILVLELLDIYKHLKSMKNLKPCDEVDELFERLVNHCISNRNSEVTEQVLQDSRIIEIRWNFRQLCDVAECCLEFHWADIIIGQEDSSPEEVYERLKHFPYFQNYIDLTKLEISAINGVRKNPLPISRIAFLGSGPLPLTSFCLCGLAGDPLHLSDVATAPIFVLNIDNDVLAISKSKILSEKLGVMGKGMEFVAADAGKSEVDLRNFDVVYLAALVGSTQEQKEAVLVKVVERMSEGALLVVRSADRLRKILYQPFDPSSDVVMGYLDICAVVHPYNHVVNSVVVGMVKRTEMGKVALKL